MLLSFNRLGDFAGESLVDKTFTARRGFAIL
jgi:hypothetical protein